MVIFQFAVLIYLRVLDIFGPILMHWGPKHRKYFMARVVFFPICLVAKIVFPWDDDDDDDDDDDCYYYY